MTEPSRLWDTIRERETLESFRCVVPEISTPCKGDDCICARECEYLIIFREHMEMRALVEVVLGGKTAAEAAGYYREGGYGSDYWGYTYAGAHLHALAEKLEALEENSEIGSKEA